MRFEYRFFAADEMDQLAPFLKSRGVDEWEIVKLQFMENGGAHLVLAIEDDLPPRILHRQPGARRVM